MDLFATKQHPGRTILVVCTGNICRSPLAAAMLRRDLGSRLTVASAGLYAVVDAPMDTIPAEIAVLSGADAVHSARQLDKPLVDAAAVILTMTSAQRDEISSRYPAATNRAFTMSEFARLAALDFDSGTLGEAVQRLSRARPNAASAQDVEDPYRKSRQVHERVGQELASMVSALSPYFIRLT